MLLDAATTCMEYQVGTTIHKVIKDVEYITM